MNKINLLLWGSPQPCKMPSTSEVLETCQTDELKMGYSDNAGICLRVIIYDSFFFSFNKYLLTSVDTILGDLAVNKRNKSSSLGILPSGGGGRGFNVRMLKKWGGRAGRDFWNIKVGVEILDRADHTWSMKFLQIWAFKRLWYVIPFSQYCAKAIREGVKKTGF